MRHNILTKLLIAAALLILAIPIGASGQVYRDRYNDRYNNRDQYDRMDPRDVRDAINRLESSSSRLENDLNYTPGRRVLGIFQLRTTDDSAIEQVRDFSRALSTLRNSSPNPPDFHPPLHQ